MKKLIVLFMPAALFCMFVRAGFTRKNEKMELIEAVKLGKIDRIQDLFLVYMINPNYNDSMGHSPLYYAVNSGNLGTIEALLNNGADPNYKNEYNGNTALHEAVLHQSQDVIIALIESGADKTIQNNKGLIPYDIALRVRLSNPDIADLVLPF